MDSGNRTEVTVVDVQMPFGSMVMFILKWTFASIPAMIVLAILGFIFMMLVGGLFTGLAMRG